MNLNDLINKFNNYEGAVLIEGCSLEALEQFENINNIKLPTEYKSWLLFSDGGELFLPAGIQLYGVKHNPIIDFDDNSRPTNDYYVIGVLASGDTILANRHNEEIAIYNILANKIEQNEIYGSFNLFLTDLENILGETDNNE